MNCKILNAKYSDSPQDTALHYHDCHQLIFIRSGNAAVTINGKCYTVGPNTLLLISRFDFHSVDLLSKEYRRYFIQIAPELGTGPYSELLYIVINRPKDFSQVLSIPEPSVFIQALDSIVDEFNRKDFQYETMLELKLLQLMLLLSRQCPQLSHSPTDRTGLVRQLQNFFETNYDTKLTLKDLSQQYHLSQSRLSHIFRQTTGQSVMGYLNACRMAAAKNMLVHTDMTVNAIVDACGFSDNSNFTRSFRLATGMTPSQFRKHFGESEE